MKFRLLSIVALLACGKRSDPAPAPVPTPEAKPTAPTPAHAALIAVDRRVELVSIVQRLAGSDEYRLATSPYARAVDEAFAPQASHPVVARTRELRARHSISFDAPIHLAVQLADDLSLADAQALIDIEPRWRNADAPGYAAQLRDFAATAKLDDFLASQRSYRAQVEQAMKAIVEREQPGPWFDALFGPSGARFHVVPGLLNGTRNFGSRATRGREMTVFAVIGLAARDGLPIADEQTVRLFVHELAHSYVNPLFAKHSDALAASGRALWPLVERKMVAQSYRTWQTMLDESGVRALTTLYLRERHGDAAGARAARTEQRAGFVWTSELADVFRGMRATKQLVPAEMDAVVRFFDKLVAGYGGALPAIAFLGPIDAAMIEPILIAPAGQLATYVESVRARVFEASPPIVAASSAALSDHMGRNVLAYGSPESNPVVKNLLGHARIQLDASGLVLGSKRFAGDDLVLIFTRFRWDDPPHGIVVYAAARDATLIGINHKVRHGDTDWVVARRARDGSFTQLDAGDFPRAVDGAWMLP